MSARFKIKVARWETKRPIVLFDADRPAFRGQYPTLRAACLAMDNRVRIERGMPERADITRADVVEAMNARRARVANLVEGRVPHAAPVRPEGYDKPASWHEYRDHAKRYGIEA